MYSFVTVDNGRLRPNGIGRITRLIQTTDSWSEPVKQSTIYYVNADGIVEFDGSAHTVSAEWLTDCVGRWTRNGDTIRAWSN